jgi:hypothetical protein
LFASHRGALRFLRRLLKPVLMLFFNANSLNQILHVQAQFNADLLKREQRRRIEFEQSRAEWNALYYEVLHNLVLETTRNGIELKNLKMRLEALASRLDFSERRVRALEGVVQYRPEVLRPRDRDRERERDRRERNAGAPESGEAADGAMPPAESGAVAGQSAGEPGARRRRRRRRGRRSGGIGPVPAAAAADEGGAGASDEYDEAADMDAGSDAAEAADESATSAESAHVSPEKTGDAATGRPNGEPDQQ